MAIKLPFFKKKTAVVKTDGKKKEKELVFKLELKQKLTPLPDFSQKEKINVTYPLIAPYAYAHIYWDKKNNEMVYEVKQPELDDTEKELLRLIQLGLEEMINVSFIKTKKLNVLLDYLERNVQSIIIELGAKISKETYKKIMYYVYRHSIGFNEIEPLLKDYYIEDIECNGTDFPIYVVHRKYGNIRSNVLFKKAQDLIDFVEKMAQRAGRYISYAKPLLDGTLPDGSRVNATYTQDVTTRGPTFTIRKFTKDPWTPIHLIESNTANAEVFAYLWLAIEHKMNIIAIGETGSGKTTLLNAILHFIPPEARVVSIEDTRELNLAHENWLPSVSRTGFGIPSMGGTTLGEVTLFDLLRESFRQNPDYVIVGEVRGKETFVLFQGMASGHPSFSTFHAASIETLVKRLSTPPISLSSSLIETLDIVIIATHVKTQKVNVRRLMEIDEVLSVQEGAAGKVKTNKMFEWNPSSDKISKGKKSDIIAKISKTSGQSVKVLQKEVETRVKLLQKLKEKNIKNYREFNSIVNEYYKEPKQVLKKYGVKAR